MAQLLPAVTAIGEDRAPEDERRGLRRWLAHQTRQLLRARWNPNEGHNARRVTYGTVEFYEWKFKKRRP